MAPVVIDFSDHTVTPPVYVAGSFTDWKAVELEATAGQDERGEKQHSYEKSFELVPGSYQHKYRLGTGNWWVCDTRKPLTHDGIGNENNLLVVDAEPIRESQNSSSSRMSPGQIDHQANGINDNDVKIPNNVRKRTHMISDATKVEPAQHNYPSQKRDSGVDLSATSFAAIAVDSIEKLKESVDSASITRTSLDADPQSGYTLSTHEAVSSSNEVGEPGPTVDTNESVDNVSESATSVSTANGTPQVIKAFPLANVSETSVGSQQFDTQSGKSASKVGGAKSHRGKKAASGSPWLSSLWYGGASSLIAMGAAVAIPAVLAYFLQK